MNTRPIAIISHPSTLRGRFVTSASPTAGKTSRITSNAVPVSRSERAPPFAALRKARSGDAEHHRDEQGDAEHAQPAIAARRRRLTRGHRRPRGACWLRPSTRVGTRPRTVAPRPGAPSTSSDPSSAPSRSAMPCRPEPRPAVWGSKPRPSSCTANRISPSSSCERDLDRRGVRVLRDVLQTLEHAEVERGFDLLGVPFDVVRVDRRPAPSTSEPGPGAPPPVPGRRAAVDRCRGRGRADRRAPVPYPPAARRASPWPSRGRDRRAARRDAGGPAARPAAAGRRRGCCAPASGARGPGRRRGASAPPAGRPAAPSRRR